MPQLSKISAQRPDQDPFAHLIDAVATRKQLLLDYLLQERFVKRFQPAHIRDAVFSYVKSGGKSLRPAVAMLACGAWGRRVGCVAGGCRNRDISHLDTGP